MNKAASLKALLTPEAGAAGFPLRAALVSPGVDALLIGGGSILFLLPLLLFGNSPSFLFDPGFQTVLAVLINVPHFMASYGIVYRSKEMILKHPWAAIHVPAVLLVFGVIAVVKAPTNALYIAAMNTVSSVYLAWHYTGQTWGMMASYAHLGGHAFADKERWLIRLGLHLLLGWHVTWFFYWSLDFRWLREAVEPVYSAMSLLTMASFVLGALGIASYAGRNRRLPPVHVLVAWAAIYCWYSAMARDFRTLFLVQIAHAVQYLIFPFRVEANKERFEVQAGRKQLRRHMIWYAVLLLGGALVASVLVPAVGARVAGRVLGGESAQAVYLAVFAFLNIHHYFTDGCVWKIRNPEVRRKLFAHVPSPGVVDFGPASQRWCDLRERL
jgi:hypothetical protein